MTLSLDRPHTTQEPRYIVAPGITENSPRFFFQVHCYDRRVGSFIVNVTTATDEGQAAIDAVWSAIGIVSVKRVEPMPF